MGGGQSQERVVTVEERPGEDGEPQITVTQDVLQYIHDQQHGRSPQGEVRGEPPPYPSEQDSPFISAEEVLTGEPEFSGGSRQHQREESSKWRQRYERERQKNAEIKNLTSKELGTAANEVREKFLNTNLHNMVPVCEECKDKLLDCYHSNPSKTLKCSSEAREYMQCVERARKGLLHPSESDGE